MIPRSLHTRRDRGEAKVGKGTAFPDIALLHPPDTAALIFLGTLIQPWMHPLDDCRWLGGRMHAHFTKN